MGHDNLAGRHGHKRPQLPGPDVVALSRTFFGEDSQSRLRRRRGAYNHDAWFFGTAPCILRWTIGFEMRAFGEVEPGAARLGAPRRARCVVHLELITPISQETKDLLEKHVKATGIKKGHLIESALRYHLRARHELPADVLVPARLVRRYGSDKAGFHRRRLRGERDRSRVTPAPERAVALVLFL